MRLLRVAFFCLALPLFARDGHWSGGIDLGRWYPIEVDFNAATIVPAGRKAQKLERVTAEGTTIRFEWPEEGDQRARFDGTLEGDSIEGWFEQGGTRARFWLARTAAVPPELFESRRGLYASGGRLLWIGRMSEGGRQPAFIDVHGGRFGLLYPSSDTAYFTGRSAFIPRPTGARFVFDGDEVTWGNTTWRRTRCCSEEEVIWQNGQVTLSGTLVKPRAVEGRLPAVVFLHGSGGQTRGYFSSLPYLLAHHGIASLVYDKRGSGRSTGSRHTATFYDLADDAIRGAELLLRRDDIDPARLGVFGHSQGGWIAPLAAHRWPRFRFAVSAAGPAVSVDEEIRNEKRAAMRAASLSEPDTRAALETLDLYFAVRKGRATWSELQRALAAASGKPWDRFIFHPESQAEILADLEDYDPAPVLRSLRVPLLAMYGGRDPAVTPEVNVPELRRHLAAAGNRVSMIRVFPDADHDFIVAASEPLLRDRYAEGYLTFVVDWIRRRFQAPG